MACDNAMSTARRANSLGASSSRAHSSHPKHDREGIGDFVQGARQIAIGARQFARGGERVIVDRR